MLMCLFESALLCEVHATIMLTQLQASWARFEMHRITVYVLYPLVALSGHCLSLFLDLPPIFDTAVWFVLPAVAS